MEQTTEDRVVRRSDPCHLIEKDVEKISGKYEEWQRNSGPMLQSLIDQLEDLRNEYENAPENHELTDIQKDVLWDVMSQLREKISRLANEHRDVHITMSKMGRNIDKSFEVDFASTGREDVFNSPEKMEYINRIIIQHFYQNGLPEVAEELAKESNIQVNLPNKEVFMELNHVINRLKVNDIEPALAWVAAHRKELLENGSTLEFKLHRLRFVELLKKGINYQTEAITYARMHFVQFVEEHEKDIQMLMGMLLFIPNGLDTSPYSTLTDSEMWLDASETFINDSCAIKNVTVSSPLTTCINAGCVALPALLNIKQIMIQRQVAGIWHGRDELPIEINLGEDSKYHSMFACPILRQQSSENNPPMRLNCGHVISRDALTKLCMGNKVKCPYCPVEQNVADARLLHF